MKSHFDQLDAIAFQLIAALEQYDEDVGGLVRRWHVEQDMERYALVSRKVDEIRNLCGALPAVAAQWVTVLISHTELMHGLLRLARPTSDAALLEEQLLDHQAVIEALRSKCRRMLLASRNGRPS